MSLPSNAHGQLDVNMAPHLKKGFGRPTTLFIALAASASHTSRVQW